VSATKDFPAELTLDPVVEQDRVQDLHALNLLDTPTEERFDRITRLAAGFFDVPLAYVAFIDRDRQWLKSSFGPMPAEIPRELTFCRYTILRDGPLLIPDAREHPISRDHPSVTGDPHLRFYAGVPLTGPRGRKIGTFCLVDFRPRRFGPAQMEKLLAFAAIVEREMNLGQIIQTQNELLRTREQLVETQKELHREFADAAKYVRRMLPPPLIGAEQLEWHFEPSAHLGGDGLGHRQIDEDRLALYMLDVTGHGLGSALLAVSALEFLRSREVRETDFARPEEVIERLNRTFQMKDHAGKFFSCWYGVFSRRHRTITYANAGHPPALVLTQGGLGRTSPGGPVLGVMPEIKAPVAVLPFPPEAELYLFTDGLYELRENKGGHGSYDEFFDHLQAEAKLRRSVWPTILSWMDAAKKRDAIDDDVSLIRFTVPA
jgi:sigma-B regulation protein RsbU (phosphoserine phosphatase)